MTYRWLHTSLEDRKNKCFKGYSNFIFDKEKLDNINFIEEIKKYRGIDFSYSIFEEDIVFDNCEFYGDIIFENTEFKKSVSFNDCIFHGDCIFVNVEFSENNKNQKIFIKSKVKGQHFILKNIKNIPRLDGITFSSCTKLILEDLVFKKSEYEYAKLVYRIARNQANIIGDYDRVGHYYYLERYYGGKTIKKENFNNYRDYLSNKCFDILSKYTIGYGEKPFNIFIISFFIISIFAFLYMFTGIKTSNNIVIGLNIGKDYTVSKLLKDYIDLWYFSMVTFSTVGYGDMVVDNTLGKIFASVEVFFGITMAASWTSVIIKRMSR